MDRFTWVHSMVKLTMTVKDAMDQKIVTVDVKTSAFDAANLMIKNKVWSLVVTEKGDYVGIVTERDIIRKCLVRGMDCRTTLVNKLMRSSLPTIESHRSPGEAMQKMADKGVRRLFVTKGGKIIGRVTQTALLMKVHELFLALEETASLT